jgi:hypothetical protein
VDHLNQVVISNKEVQREKNKEAQRRKLTLTDSLRPLRKLSALCVKRF